MRAIALIVALAAGAGAAWAQASTTPAPPRGLVFHVAAARGVAPTVSLGVVQATGARAQLRQRREMQADCTWSQARDLAVPLDSVAPLRDPAGLGGAEEFGDYYATLFSSLAAAQGAVTTSAQYACVRRTMARLGQSLMRRRANAISPQP